VAAEPKAGVAKDAVAGLEPGDRCTDEAEAEPEQGDRPTAFDRAFDAEMPGFVGGETG
jgi:hypothetical protein